MKEAKGILAIMPESPSRGRMGREEDDDEVDPGLVSAVAEYQSASSDEERAAAFQRAVRMAR